MSKTLLATLLALGITVVSSTVMAVEFGQSRQIRGLDNPAGHVRQGRGLDDPAGHIRQGRGADDPVGHISGRDRVRNYGGLGYGNKERNYGAAAGVANQAGYERGRGRGRGGDNPASNIGSARGADNTATEVRGASADGHISGRDRVRFGGMGAIGLVGR